MAQFSVKKRKRRIRNLQLSLWFKYKFMGYLTGKNNRFTCSVCSEKLQNRILLTLPITGTQTSSFMPLKTRNLYPKNIWNEAAESLFRANGEDPDAISYAYNSTKRVAAKKGECCRIRMVQGEERSKFFSSLKLNAFFLTLPFIINFNIFSL